MVLFLFPHRPSDCPYSAENMLCDTIDLVGNRIPFNTSDSRPANVRSDSDVQNVSNDSNERSEVVDTTHAEDLPDAEVQPDAEVLPTLRDIFGSDVNFPASWNVNEEPSGSEICGVDVGCTAPTAADDEPSSSDMMWEVDAVDTDIANATVSTNSAVNAFVASQPDMSSSASDVYVEVDLSLSQGDTGRSVYSVLKEKSDSTALPQHSAASASTDPSAADLEHSLNDLFAVNLKARR